MFFFIGESQLQISWLQNSWLERPYWNITIWCVGVEEQCVWNIKSVLIGKVRFKCGNECEKCRVHREKGCESSNVWLLNVLTTSESWVHGQKKIGIFYSTSYNTQGTLERGRNNVVSRVIRRRTMKFYLLGITQPDQLCSQCDDT